MIDRNFKIVLSVCISLTLLFSAFSFFYGTIPGIICLACGVIITISFIIFTKKRVNKIEELNNYLGAVCSGKLYLDLPDNSEGELSILKNNLYKVIAMLRFQNEQLKKDKLYLADSMTDISHQLKTPLTSMMVMSDILKDEQSAEKRKDFVDIIQTQLEKMRWLIQNLLKLSKLDAGTVEFKREPLSAKAVVDESVKPFLINFDLREIKQVQSGGDFIFPGDEDWITEAISNIIKNDIEHTPCGGKIEIKFSSTALFGLISITDNGCGIDEEDQKHIFERFYRGKNSSPDSVGIGLPLSQAIVRQHGGKITVKSEIEKGTTFNIFLPLYIEDA